MKNKRILAIIAAMTIAAQTAAIGSADALSLSVNGVAVEEEIIVNENVKMLPLRALAETIGYEVNWIDETRTVVLSGIGEEIKLNPSVKGAMARSLASQGEIFENRTYVPVSFVSDTLGLAFEEDSKGNVNVFAATEEKIVRKVTVNSISEGEIIANDEVIGEVVIKISEETKITKEGKEASLSDITEESILMVEYGPAMTMSLPPQALAVSIEIVTENALENVTYEGEIAEITEDGMVIVKNEKDPYGVALKITENTQISHAMNRRLYKAEDLEVGMKITAEHSNVMTRSLPPQTEAISIVIK